MAATGRKRVEGLQSPGVPLGFDSPLHIDVSRGVEVPVAYETARTFERLRRPEGAVDESAVSARLRGILFRWRLKHRSLFLTFHLHTGFEDEVTDPEHLAIRLGFQRSAESAGLKMREDNAPVIVRDVVHDFPMAIITHVRIFTEEPASVIKQLLAQRIVRFGYTPVYRSDAPLDDVDASLHIETDELRVTVRAVATQWRANSRVHSNCRTAIRWFDDLVNRHHQPEVPKRVLLDGALGLRDFIDRWFLEKTHRSYRFRKNRQLPRPLRGDVVVFELHGFLDPEDVSLLSLLLQRLEGHFEPIDVAVPLVRERRFEVLDGLEDRLLPDGFWGVENPLLALEKRVVLSCDERIAQDELIRLVCLVVDSRYTSVVSIPCAVCVFIQRQFLGFRRIQLYLSHPQDS